MKNVSKYRGLSMPDPRLLQFLGLIAILNVLDLVDHIFRGDFHWPIDEQSVGFIGVATIILGEMALGCAALSVRPGRPPVLGDGRSAWFGTWVALAFQSDD